MTKSTDCTENGQPLSVSPSVFFSENTTLIQPTADSLYYDIRIWSQLDTTAIKHSRHTTSLTQT